MNEHTNRTRKKLLPCPPYETDFLETWLEEQAAQGLFLLSIGSYWATFEQTEPQTLFYRVDIMSQKQVAVAGARRAQIESCGWEYVAYDQRARIYRSTAPLEEELPPMPDERTRTPMTLVDLRGGQLVFLLIFACYILSLLQNPISLFGPTDPAHNFVDGYFVLFLIPALIACNIFCHVILEGIVLWRFRRRMRIEGFPNRSTYSQQRTKKTAYLRLIAPFLSACTLVLCLLCCAPFLGPNMQLLTSDTDLPFPLLAEINAEEGAALAAVFATEDNVQRAYSENFWLRTYNPLVPTMLSSQQYGPRPILEETEQRVRTGPSPYGCNVSYYRMISQNLADRYWAECLNDQSASTPYTPLPTSEGTSAVYAQSEYGQKLLMRCDKVLIRIDYSGATDLSTCVPLLENYLTAVQ